jgi:hypothetical protein
MTKKDQRENNQALTKLNDFLERSYLKEEQEILENMVEVMTERARYQNVSKLVNLYLEDDNYKIPSVWKYSSAKETKEKIEQEIKQNDKVFEFLEARMAACPLINKFTNEYSFPSLAYIMCEFWDREEVLSNLKYIFGDSEIGKTITFLALVFARMEDLDLE